MGTIEPLKAELEREKKLNEDLEAKIAHCTKEVKSERNTQAIMAKQFNVKMKVTGSYKEQKNTFWFSDTWLNYTVVKFCHFRPLIAITIFEHWSAESLVKVHKVISADCH